MAQLSNLALGHSLFKSTKFFDQTALFPLIHILRGNVMPYQWNPIRVALKSMEIKIEATVSFTRI